MIWTNTQPTKSGWYWWRMSPEHPGGLYHFAGEEFLRYDDDMVDHIEDFDGGQWSSEPIPYPTEEAQNDTED